jgi:malate permease and related proteins
MFTGIFLIFCFLMIGYAMKLAKKDYSDVLIQFCVIIAFPALIIQKLYPLKIEFSNFSVVFIAIFSILLGFLIGFLISRLFGFDKKSSAVVILSCGLGNTSFVGFPFVEAMFGFDALSHALLFDQFGSFLFLTVFGSIIAAWGVGKDSSVKKLLKNVFLFPPFIAILAAFLMKPFALPTFFLDGCAKLSVTLLPLVSIAIGMKIDIRHIKERLGKTALVLSVKMMVVPLGVFVFMKLLGLPFDAPHKVALVESAMPPMVMVAVFAARYSLDEKLAVSAVALGVFVSFVSVPLFYYLG